MRVKIRCLLIALLSGVAGYAQAADHVSLRLDWTLTGVVSPYFVAADRGYYKAAGIDVDILEGKGSGNTIQLVANGTDTFGLADAAVVARSASSGVPVKVVMGVIRKGPASLLFLTTSGIKTPADIRGRSVLSCPGQAPLVLLPAYLKAIGLQTSDVRINNVDCGAVFPLLAQGKADLATGFTPGSISNLARAGVTNVGYFDYADKGIVLPSSGIFTSTKIIESNPDLVRRFVSATRRGWEDSLKDIPAAIATEIKGHPLLKGQEKTFEAELLGYSKYISTARTMGKPFGWQSAEDWADAEKIMVEYMGVKAPSSLDTYYTNQFVEPN